MFVHSGTSEGGLHYTVGLHSMTGSSTDVTLSQADAMLLDPGTVLEHDGETIQVVNAPQQVRGQQWSARVSRGFGGTAIHRHDPALWRITAAPHLIGPGSPPIYVDEAKRANCKTCGAPDQRVGERCHYCIHIVTA